MSISMNDIKDLRAKTGAGISDCKKALTECKGNVEESIDWLRKKGIASAGKKAGRETAEGAVAIANNGNKAVIAEVNIETDFAAKNEKFRDLVDLLIKVIDETDEDSTDAVLKSDFEGKLVDDIIKENISIIGENISFRRFAKLSVDKGVIVDYIHNKTFDNQGKIGVLVALEGSGDKTKMQEVAKQIAMHIAANKPESLNIESLDPVLIEKEKQVLTEQARASGKPDNVIEKMIEGRINKFYGEVVLLEQPFVMDNKLKVKDVVANLAKDLGSNITLKSFICFNLGEGIERKEATSFADEVASMTKSN